MLCSLELSQKDTTKANIISIFIYVCLSQCFFLSYYYHISLWGNCRLAGVAMIVPIINYKWRSLPNELTKDDYRKNLCRWIIWLLRHTPGLLHWWLTQKLFPSANVLDHSPAFFNNKDLDSLRNTPGYQLFTQVIFITTYYILVSCKCEYESTFVLFRRTEYNNVVHLNLYVVTV